MTKIIPLFDGYFEKKKQRPLTSLMVISLIAACEKQRSGIPFGPSDIKGSFTALITRGLIVRKKETTSMDALTWHITVEAIDMLKAMGIKIEC